MSGADSAVDRSTTRLRAAVIGGALAFAVTLLALASAAVYTAISMSVRYGVWKPHNILVTLQWAVLVVPASVPVGLAFGLLARRLVHRRLLVLVLVMLVALPVVEATVIGVVTARGCGVHPSAMRLISETIAGTLPFTVPWLLLAAYVLERATRR